MTGAHRRENHRAEMERARSCLRSARLLLEHGQEADSVSRSYYAMLHGARALLLTEGLEARSHRGVSHLVNQHFVRTGRLAPELARSLSRHQADREAADYDSDAVFTEDLAEEVLEAAERFLAEVERLSDSAFS